MCYDGHAEGLEVFITAGMITMDVAVDQETQRMAVDGPDRRVDLIGEGCKLVIDHQDAIGTGQHADVATGAFEHIDIVGDGDGFDPDGVEVLLGLGKAKSKDKKNGSRQTVHETGGWESKYNETASFLRKNRVEKQGQLVEF